MFVKVHRRCGDGDLFFDSSHFLCVEQVLNSRTCDHLFTNLYLSDGYGYVVFEIRETPEKVINLLCS